MQINKKALFIVFLISLITVSALVSAELPFLPDKCQWWNIFTWNGNPFCIEKNKIADVENLDVSPTRLEFIGDSYTSSCSPVNKCGFSVYDTITNEITRIEMFVKEGKCVDIIPIQACKNNDCRIDFIITDCETKTRDRSGNINSIRVLEPVIKEVDGIIGYINIDKQRQYSKFNATTGINDTIIENYIVKKKIFGLVNKTVFQKKIFNNIDDPDKIDIYLQWAEFTGTGLTGEESGLQLLCRFNETGATLDCVGEAGATFVRTAGISPTDNHVDTPVDFGKNCTDSSNNNCDYYTASALAFNFTQFEDFTMIAFMNPSGITSEQHMIFDNGVDGAGRGIAFTLDGSLVPWIFASGGSQILESADGCSAFTANKWQTFVLTVNNTAGSGVGHVWNNGTKDCTDALQTESSSTALTPRIFYRASQLINHEPFYGVLDEFAIFYPSLNEVQILNLHESYFTELNNAPVVTAVLNSTPANLNFTANNLNCHNTSQSDADGDTITTTYRWFNSSDGSVFELMPFISTDLSSDNTTKGQFFQCEITVDDASETVFSNSSILEILNSLIVLDDIIPNIVIDAGVSWVSDSINCSDGDNDAITYGINDSRIDVDSNGFLNDTAIETDTGVHIVLGFCSEGTGLNASQTFTYTVSDATAPSMSSVNVNDTNPSEDDFVNVSILATDGLGLSFCWLSSSLSQSNTTPVVISGISADCNSVIEINDTGGTIITFIYYANDTSGNLISNSTMITVFTPDSENPVVSALTVNDSNPFFNQSINVSMTVTDNIGLSFCWMFSSLTGTITSPVAIGGNSSSCNSVSIINTTAGTEINYTFFANDSQNNIGRSTRIITVASPSILSDFPLNNLLELIAVVAVFIIIFRLIFKKKKKDEKND